MMPYAIVPFIDNFSLTRQAVQDLLAQSVQPTILLIDNGSTETPRSDVEDLVRESRGRVLAWFHTPPLLSLSATWNRALQFVWESGGTEALLVNNDVRLHRETYQVLLDVQAATHAYLVTGVECKDELLWQAAQHADVWRAGAHLPLPRLEGPSFSCFLLTKEGHQKYPFDEGYQPAYVEDVDLHRRMMLKGDGQKIFGLNLPFFHVGSATINRSAVIAHKFSQRIDQGSRRYHREKWGGSCNEEIWTRPFDLTSKRDGVTTPELFERVRYGHQVLP